MWFIFSLVCITGWGTADLFYKKSSDEADKYSHLKIVFWVGLVMGAASFLLLPFSENGFDFASLIKNAVNYAPASFSYIISMAIGYAGMRYLEISIISPVQNASGAFSAIAMALYFVFSGKVEKVIESFDVLSIIGTTAIVIGVIALAVVEQKLSHTENTEDKKYIYGAAALLFPIAYCFFDTIGTAADGIILDSSELGEIDVLILYGFTFLLVGIFSWIYIFLKTKKPYNPFKSNEIKTKGVAAISEEFGQIFYVFAMAESPMTASPMISAYCIFSVILSRIFINEKLKASQYACVVTVIIGIIMLGIAEI